MSNRDVRTGSSLRGVGRDHGDPIITCLNELRARGDFIARNAPTNVKQDIYVDIENLLQRLLGLLEEELQSRTSLKDKSKMDALVNQITQEISPLVSMWSEYAKATPQEKFNYSASYKEALFTRFYRIRDLLRSLPEDMD